MSDSIVTISTPIATIVDASSKVFASIMAYAEKVRETESPLSRDEEDHIRFQAYWDWRGVLQFCKIVGDPLPWPPSGPPK